MKHGTDRDGERKTRQEIKKKNKKKKRRVTHLSFGFPLLLHLALALLDGLLVLARLLALGIGRQARTGAEWLLGIMPVFSWKGNRVSREMTTDSSGDLGPCERYIPFLRMPLAGGTLGAVAAAATVAVGDLVADMVSRAVV